MVEPRKVRCRDLVRCYSTDVMHRQVIGRGYRSGITRTACWRYSWRTDDYRNYWSAGGNSRYWNTDEVSPKTGDSITLLRVDTVAPPGERFCKKCFPDGAFITDRPVPRADLVRDLRWRVDPKSDRMHVPHPEFGGRYACLTRRTKGPAARWFTEFEASEPLKHCAKCERYVSTWENYSNVKAWKVLCQKN